MFSLLLPLLLSDHDFSCQFFTDSYPALLDLYDQVSSEHTDDADFTADLSPEKTKEGALEALKNAIAAAGLQTGNFYMEGFDREAAADDLADDAAYGVVETCR